MLIVLGRVVFASAFLLLTLRYLKINIRLHHSRHYIAMAAMGIVLAVHWCAFYLSIQMSTVAIGLLTFATFPAFVTFLEPVVFQEKIRLADVATAMAAFAGILLVIPRFAIGDHITQGVLWGLLSGFTYAILSVLNRKYVKPYSGLTVAFYEQLSAAIVLLAFFFWQPVEIQMRDILLLCLLGVVFTGVSHALFINSLKHLKVQMAGIISCLEPVYGIIFAALLLDEMPTWREGLGGVIVLSAVFYSMVTLEQGVTTLPPGKSEITNGGK